MKPWQIPKAQRKNTKTGFSDVFGGVTVASSKGSASEDSIKKLVQAAKSSGKLVLSNRELEKIPDAAFSDYEVGKRNVVVDFGSSASESNSGWWGAEPLTKLYLADNKLSDIPERLANTFPNLTTLDLHGNNISHLPNNLSEIQELSSLNLSRNEFKETPEPILKLPISDLNMAHNKLTLLIPEGISFPDNLTRLTQLDLSHNQLRELPSELGGLVNLRSLSLSYNKLTTLPSTFISWPHLEYLNLGCNILQELPFLIASHSPAFLPLLKTLDLHNNRLRQVDIHPESNLGELQQLMLGGNMLTSLGNVLTKVPKLAALTLGSNSLDSLPDGLLQLTSLAQLDISSNCISRIPPQLGNLTSLNSLLIQGNPLRATPHMTSTQDFLAALRSRIPPPTPVDSEQEKVLKSPGSPPSSSSEPTSTIQSSLVFSSQEKSTRTVRLNNKKLSDDELEKEFVGELPFSPATLELMKNLLTKSPTSLLERFSSTLVNLNLSMNKIASFELTTSLPNLTHLVLGGNKLTKFPHFENSASLPKLTTLDVSMNRIDNLPQSPMENLPSIQSLLISGNLIVDLEPALPFLTSLTHLDISNNNIKSVPPQLASPGSKLVGLELMGNAFLFPRHQVLQRGSAYVLEFLRARIPKS